MGFALWLDESKKLAWVQGTQEYRPMGTAVIAIGGQFRHRDFDGGRARPAHLANHFAGFFGSLEEVNQFLKSRPKPKRRVTPHIAR